MTKKRGKENTFVSYIIVILLLFAVVGASVYYFRTIKSEDKNSNKQFAVYLDSVDVETKENGILLASKGVKFDCISKSDNILFSVDIVPYVTQNNDFEFDIDGVGYIFSAEQNLTSYFNVQVYDDYFIVGIDKEIKELLLKKYNGKTIQMRDLDYAKIYFAIEVYNFETETIIIPFAIDYVVTSIVLDREQIVYG